MAKKVTAFIKLQVKAQEATPAPPIGPALGQHGVSHMEFCKAFNAQTQSMKKGLPIPVVITVYNDRSFTFILKTPPASYCIKDILGLKSGSSNPKATKVAKLSKKQVEEIATLKRPDLTAASMEAACRTIAGTARSMGVDVEK